MGNKAANEQITKAEGRRDNIQRDIDNFSYSNPLFSQGLNNPFAEATNTAANLTNPFAGQQVALQAADYQRQATDTQLANTLDAITQGGGNAAASATALARQSAQSNQQIGAGIQQQEAQNQRLAAQGEQARQQAVAQGEARRQQLVGQGQQFITGLSEQRAAADLAGLGNQFAAEQQSINAGYQNIAQNNAAIWGAVGNVVGGAASVATGKLIG